MASWNIPALINKISEDVPAIKALLTALFKWTDADTTDVPLGAKRLQAVAGGKQMQEYSGSAWASVGKLMHDCDMLDGKHASTAQTADTIPVRDANGTIPGNISGNAATATSAYGLDSGYTVPVANGGTGATTEAGARASLGADNASNISSGILDIAYGGTGSSTKNFVDLTENQNVGGTKTFSSEIKNTAGVLISGVMTGVSNADTTRGQDSVRQLAIIRDKDNKLFSGLEAFSHADGSRSMYFLMRNRADSAWIKQFTLKELADGTVQTLVQTPPAAANDTQIATTAWVTTFCETTKEYLKKTGDALTGALQCTATYTDSSGTTHTSNLLKFNASNTAYGNNVALGGGGNTIVGGGESYNAQLNALEGDGSENLYLCADGSIYLKPNCNTFANAKTITIDASGNMSGLGTVTASAFVGVFPANTRMLFQQSAAPTGWTKETGSSYNNKALRLVTGDVVNKTDGKAFTTCMASGRTTANKTQGGTIGDKTAGGSISKTTAGGTVGNKALSVAMLAKHKHDLLKLGTADGGSVNCIWKIERKSSAWDGAYISDSGSGSNHNHGFTGSEHGHTFTGTAHTHTFTGSAHNHSIDLDINYIDCIIAKKA